MMIVQAAMEAVRANPKDPAAWVALGDALAASGELGKARDSYETALKHMPLYQPALAGLQRFNAAPPPTSSSMSMSDGSPDDPVVRLLQQQVTLLEHILRNQLVLSDEIRQLRVAQRPEEPIRDEAPREGTKRAGPLPAMQVSDFDMPFWHMVRVMIKAAFASIPASIVFTTIVTAVLVLVGSSALRLLIEMLT